MNNDDTWVDLFLFCLVTDNAETVADLIRSDNCEEKFMDIVRKIAAIDSEYFQRACIDWLIRHKEKLMELNKTYKTSQKESEKQMTKEAIIKSVLKDLVKMHIEEGSVGIAVDNDPDHDCCWDDVLAWIEEPHQPRWIPVSERLPEDGQSVLFCDIDNDIMLGYHIKGRPNTHFSQDGTFADTKDVRAWMPLPEPYKAESEDEEKMTIQGAVYELEQMLSNENIPDYIKPTIKKVIETITDEFNDRQSESNCCDEREQGNCPFYAS